VFRRAYEASSDTKESCVLRTAPASVWDSAYTKFRAIINPPGVGFSACLPSEGELAQRFFNACEDHNVHVHITSGSIREIKPDGTNRFVADILAAVYAEERRSLIRRTKPGQERDLENGQRVGQPPLGSTTDADGYLVPNCEFYGNDYNPDQDGFFGVAQTLGQIDTGESYLGAASELECTRQALASIDLDDEYRGWYLQRDACEGRIQRAPDELRA